MEEMISGEEGRKKKGEFLIFLFSSFSSFSLSLSLFSLPKQSTRLIATTLLTNATRSRVV